MISTNLPIIHLAHTHWRRADMPQIADVETFESYLRDHGANFRRYDISPIHLHATQNEVNLKLVFKIISSGLNTHAHPLVVSSDNHILDGHNRWYAGYVIKQPVHCIVVEREIHSLLHLALEMPNVHKETISDTAIHR